MTSVLVLASGTTPQARNQARGKLFERCAAALFRQLGYEISATANVIQAGLELDISGNTKLGNRRLVAECKCYSDPVGAPLLQGFVGKFAPQYYADNKTQGVFVALPCLGAAARGFVQEELSKTPFEVEVIEAPKFVELLIEAGQIQRPPTHVPGYGGTVGEQTLLVTPNGLFWRSLLVPAGGAVPSEYALTNASGAAVSDPQFFRQMEALDDELGQYKAWIPEKNETAASDLETENDLPAVEVKVATHRFEYQFPSNPEFFVGREAELDQLASFVRNVWSGTSSSKTIVVDGNSGWGKSSVIAATCNRLRSEGNLAISIDSRSALTGSFVIQVARAILERYIQGPGGQSTLDAASLSLSQKEKTGITGFADAFGVLEEIATALQAKGRGLLVFFDQFENVFFQPTALARIRQLAASASNSEAPIALGFAWKTDLVASTKDFPFADRDAIEEKASRIRMGRFQEAETSSMLNDLGAELKTRLPKDLRHTLSRYSQGYPWLLKKLCSHVIRQKDNGVPLRDMAARTLNIEDLFALDLRDLSAIEEETLRAIAAIAPVSAGQLGEDFDPAILTSLLNKRLLVRVGPRYDVYWDIFRDYLTTGKVPPLLHYLPRIQSAPTIKAAVALSRLGTSMPVEEVDGVIARAGSKSTYNLLKELRLCGLVTMSDNEIHLQFSPGTTDEETIARVMDHLEAHLKRNRLVDLLRRNLERRGPIELQEVAEILRDECPYIEASSDSWQTYARILSDWMNCVGLAKFPRGSRNLAPMPEGAFVRDPAQITNRRARGVVTLSASSGSVCKVADRIAAALKDNRRLDWTGIPRSTVSKSILALDDLGLVSRDQGLLQFGGDMPIEFFLNPEARPAIARERLERIPAFQAFLEIVVNHSERLPVGAIGAELAERLDANWSQGTIGDVAKYFLNWARFSGCEVGEYAR